MDTDHVKYVNLKTNKKDGAVMSDQNGKELQIKNANLPSEKSIKLTATGDLDLSGLPDDQIHQLKKDFASGMIDVHKKAAELRVDVGALDSALHSFTEQTEKATKAGAHATITHTQTTSLGRTEVIIGNTEKAARGKISRSASGEKDRTFIILGIIAVVIIILAFIIVGK